MSKKKSRYKANRRKVYITLNQVRQILDCNHRKERSYITRFRPALGYIPVAVLYFEVCLGCGEMMRKSRVV